MRRIFSLVLSRIKAEYEEHSTFRLLDFKEVRLGSLICSGLLSRRQKSGSNILKSKESSKITDLRTLHDRATIYPLLLQYARDLWPQSKIVCDLDLDAAPGSIPFLGKGSAISYPFIYKDGIRFGSVNAQNTSQDQFATVDFSFGRIPCRLLYHFELRVGNNPPAMCTAIQKTVADDDIPLFPFDIEYISYLFYCFLLAKIL